MRQRLQVLVELNIFSYLSLKRIYDQFIRWLLLKLQCEHFLEHVSEFFGDHFEHLLGVLDGEALPEEVLEFVVGIFELVVDVAPGEVVFVEEIDHDVEATLNIISPRFIVTSA